MGSAYLFYSNCSYSYMPIYQLLCMSSQVDMTKCKNITVFLAPSVVSSIVITVLEWPHLKPGETQKVLSLFQLKIAICKKKKKNCAITLPHFCIFLISKNVSVCLRCSCNRINCFGSVSVHFCIKVLQSFGIVLLCFSAFIVAAEVAGWASWWCLSGSWSFSLHWMDAMQDWGTRCGQSVGIQHANTETAHLWSKRQHHSNGRW